jgi:glycosyltransferase involved in cell wall biosynthesis
LASFDVVDATTGDGWVWSRWAGWRARRPPLLITRSHGLEHVVDDQQRALAANGRLSLSWKYPIYHGGFRLWEVSQSLRRADHCILLNDIDRRIAIERLGISPDRISVIPNGIADNFLDGPPVLQNKSGPLRAAFVGSWIARKGIETLAQAFVTAADAGVNVELSILGARQPAAQVLAHFPEAFRARIRVVPSFQNHELPRLLADHDVLLFLSRSEGFSLALIEGMACGLAPIATLVGGNAAVIESGRTGLLVGVDDVDAVVTALANCAADRENLLKLRRAAVAAAAGYRWSTVARQTLVLYESLIAQKTAQPES